MAPSDSERGDRSGRLRARGRGARRRARVALRRAGDRAVPRDGRLLRPADWAALVDSGYPDLKGHEAEVYGLWRYEIRQVALPVRGCRALEGWRHAQAARLSIWIFVLGHELTHAAAERRLQRAVEPALRRGRGRLRRLREVRAAQARPRDQAAPEAAAERLRALPARARPSAPVASYPGRVSATIRPRPLRFTPHAIRRPSIERPIGVPADRATKPLRAAVRTR